MKKTNQVRNVISNSVLEVDFNTDKKREITPLIKIKLLIEDKLEVSGVYDSGSQISNEFETDKSKRKMR